MGVCMYMMALVCFLGNFQYTENKVLAVLGNWATCGDKNGKSYLSFNYLSNLCCQSSRHLPLQHPLELKL